MSRHETLQVPDSLKSQLHRFRNRVWKIKLIEAFAIALAGFAAAFLIVYGWDRLTDMPSGIRTALLVATLVIAGVIPLFLVRWVLRYRKLESLARLLAQKMPSIGDQLLGVLELSKSDSEQARSPELCRAAIKQVAHDAQQRDFLTATPNSHYRLWSTLAAVLLVGCAALGAVYPDAFKSSFARLIRPWSNTPRYTFTQIAPIAPQVIIAHGETSQFRVQLDESTRWHPESATLTIGNQPPLLATRTPASSTGPFEEYVFEIPPQIDSLPMTVAVGDVQRQVQLEPKLRPELESIAADVRLPDYLGRPETETVDARAGRVTLVRGSSAVVTATANRSLRRGSINDVPRQTDGSQLTSESVSVNEQAKIQFQWQDQYGLTGREPFNLSIDAVEDQAPTLMVDGLPRQAVVLDSEMLKFTVRCSDDFGVRKAGLMWRSLDPRFVRETIEDEKTLASGNHQQTELEAIGTFSAKSLHIPPQPIELFVWAEDYLPQRERVFSPPHILYVLTPDQHAIWMTEQLSKWHRQALDVRDRERQLYESNKQLRDLPTDQLDLADNRKAIERQASAERANGRRLDRLGNLGDELIQTASRNPEIGVGHLERWAEMLQVLQDLSENRMPSVANLLADASKSKPGQMASTQAASPKSSPSGPKAGQSRAAAAGTPNKPHPGESPKLRSAPQLADMESSANSPDDQQGEPGPPKKPSSPALRLPVTTVVGKAQPKKNQPPQNQQGQMQEAVEEQKELLAEFDKLADEMNEILANLEGSTLVKRLKAASRTQDLVASKLTSQLAPAFGVGKYGVEKQARNELKSLSETEQDSVQTISYIMDDLASYFQRRRFQRFKATLDEMKSTDILGGLRDLSEKIPTRQGLSVSQSEYWADALDRWAENLVDPACNGSCPGGKSPESLPPSIVLEVLQILEAEIDLREETRVAEQAKDAINETEYQQSANTLAQSQQEIDARVVNVIDRILQLPDATKHFGKELTMLRKVDSIMQEATDILQSPETGAPAIAAETEAIETLLRSKRINPNGGGGGGASPGGGGSGNTVDSALALVGKGRNEKEVRTKTETSQTTGETGTVYPEEFRQGLDQYFNRLGDES